MNSRFRVVAGTAALSATFGFAGATGAILIFHSSLQGEVGPEGARGPAGPAGPVGDSSFLVQHIAALEAKVGDGSLDLTTFGCSPWGGVNVVTGVSLIPTASSFDPYMLNVQRATICVDQ